MMDSILEFSDAQSIATTPATGGSDRIFNSTNYIDIGGYIQQPGRGRPIWINVVVSTGFGGNPASTFLVYLQTGKTASRWASGIIIASGNASQFATAGETICRISLPAAMGDAIDQIRYIGLVYRAQVGMKAGAVNAWLDIDGATGAHDTKRYGSISGE